MDQVLNSIIEATGNLDPIPFEYLLERPFSTDDIDKMDYEDLLYTA